MVSRSNGRKGDPAGLQKKEDQLKSEPVDLPDRGSAGVPGDTEIDIVRCLRLWQYMDRNNRVAGWLTSILHRMGVVLMDKKPFDFKDLMSFGMFILALLTFVFANLK